MKLEIDLNCITSIKKTIKLLELILDKMPFPPEKEIEMGYDAIEPQCINELNGDLLTDARLATRHNELMENEFKKQILENPGASVTYLDSDSCVIEMGGKSTPADSIAAPLSFSGSNEEVDSAGEQWNSEIHSRGKTKTQDGRWRLKRGVEVPPPPVVSAPTVVAVPTPPLAPTETMDFNSFVTYVVDNTASGKLDKQKVLQVVQSKGLTDILELNNKPHLIPEIMEVLKHGA